MNHQHMIRIYRSPKGGEGGGAADAGAADAGAADAGAAEGASSGAAAGAADGGAAGETAPSYVSKSDFDSFVNEFRQQSRARQEPAKVEPAKTGEPKEPDLNEYDFKKPGELNRYNRDNYKWLRSMEKAEEAETNAKTERETAIKKNESGHLQRVSDYRKQNPDFDADMKKGGNIQVYDVVKHAIFASKNSASVQHFLAKNPGSADELNLLAQTEGAEAVRERIGEMAADMRRSKESLNTAEAAARVRVPRQNLRGGASSGGGKRSLAELYEDFTS